MPREQTFSVPVKPVNSDSPFCFLTSVFFQKNIMQKSSSRRRFVPYRYIILFSIASKMVLLYLLLPFLPPPMGRALFVIVAVAVAVQSIIFWKKFRR